MDLHPNIEKIRQPKRVKGTACIKRLLLRTPRIAVSIKFLVNSAISVALYRIHSIIYNWYRLYY